MERETARIVDEGSGLSDPISLTLPSSPEYVLLARLVMGQAGRLAGLDPEEIEYRILPLGVEVSVTDAGGGFSVADLTGETDEHGGFGLTVIRNLVDELVLDSTKGGGTRLKMIRRVRG